MFKQTDKINRRTNFTMQLLDNMGIPAFLSKLRKMVDDPKTDNLICWSKDGKSFIIRKEIEFWYTLLPVYYKHNNMSSFVRQLNMYGFHKVSNFETIGSNDGENETIKPEYHFLHPYFQRDQPDLLKSIKRKVTNSRIVSAERAGQEPENEEQFTKVLTEVKNLKNRQTQVDSVLNNLKQENAVLWRELAVLRQKHQKQQQIVNKLIQFLVTIVQPSSRMGGLGVKRRYPLMLNENPKKPKTSSTSSSTTADGPTIHELDSSEVVNPEGLFSEEEVAEIEEPIQADNPLDVIIESPPSISQQVNRTTLQNQSQLNETEIEPGILLERTSLENETDHQPNPTLSMDSLLNDTGITEDDVNISLGLDDDDEFINEEPDVDLADDSDKVFLSPSSQNALLTNLLQGSYNENALTSGHNRNNLVKKNSNVTAGMSATPNMTVATRDPTLGYTKLNASGSGGSENFISSHVDNLVGTTQSELEQLKDFFRGCNGIDTSYLLNLFNDAPSFGLTLNSGDEIGGNDILSGTELAPYDSTEVDFNELLDDSTDLTEEVKPEFVFLNHEDESLNTPEVSSTFKPFPFDKNKK